VCAPDIVRAGEFGDKNTAHFRLVRTGRKIKGLVEIISGIHPGDRYIVNPGPGVQDNVLVEAES
jgi:hypothetical protein